MPIVSLNTIKNWFKTGLKPTQTQFWDAWDSFRHKSDPVPYENIEGLDAVLFEQNNKINKLSLPDTVLKTGEIMVNGLNVAIVANGFQWRLNQQSFLATPAFSRVMPAATEGFKRTDNLEGDDTGNYFIVPGVEDEFAAPAPATTEGRIVLASIPVFGGAIGAIETSFPNEIETPFTVIDRANRKGISIWPFTISLWKWVFGIPVYVNVLIDNVTQKYDVQFPNKPTGTETFAMVSDLDAKLDVSAYNQHFKGVHLTEAALIAEHPTATPGDSAQVNEVGATDVVNYSWDAEGNVWVNNGSGGSGAVNTDALPEGSTNLYFTISRFLANLTTANVKAALGITTLSGSNTGDQDLSIYELKNNETPLTDASVLLWNLSTEKVAYLLATSAIGNTRTLPNSVITSGQNSGNYQLFFKQDAVGGRTILFEDSFSVFGDFNVQPNGVTIVSIVTRGINSMVVLTAETLEIPETRDLGFAISDEDTSLVAGTAKLTFRMPYGMNLTEVRSNLKTAPTGQKVIVDINQNGVSILSTKLSIDIGELTSTTASISSVISNNVLVDDAEIVIDIDQIGSTISGSGLKLWLIGTKI